MIDQSIFITGAAGEGIQTIGDVLAHGFLVYGYPVFTYKEYESRIRGGNSSYRIRVGDAVCNAPRHHADMLLALNDRARDHYLPCLRSDGFLLGDGGSYAQSIHVPFKELAVEHGGSDLYANAVAAGALCAAVGLPLTLVENFLRETFAHHGEEIVSANLSAARAGYADARNSLGDHMPPELPRRKQSYAFASAHETIPIAAAAAGCRFMSAYPMSPSTGIITAFARRPELGVFAEQAEDEIAAINMALGASAAGARAMTATSGGGFALMVESISLAGMIETPIVVVLAQRPGPATGLPTRTAQEDLLFAIYAGHGEFPRLILAPSDPQDAVHKTIRAFDIAEQFQIPVILLTDQFLADSKFSLDGLSIPDDGVASYLADPTSFKTYARYRFTEDGVSPRLYLGQSEHIVCLDSDEHTEEGHITEDLAVVRPAMVEKRLEKARRLRQVIAAPTARRIEDAELVLIGWGSTKGAIDEAVDRLRLCGDRVGSLHFTEVWPLPEFEFRRNVRYWTIEGNASGRLARLLAAEYGLKVAGRIGRYDGLPIDATTILEKLS
jgi:2-oxoglutarate ferredoxin oxidoreductase subunit alpha